MANTYTTSWNFVNNGDTTTIDPRNLVGENNVNILSANIQWKGSETSSSSTSTDYSTNTNTTSATAYTSTTTKSDSDGQVLFGGTTDYVSFPSVPDGYSFVSHRLEIEVDTLTVESGGSDTKYTYENVDETQLIETFVSPGKHKTIYNETTYTDHTSDALRTITAGDNPDGTVDAYIEAFTTYEKTTVESDTSCTSYPSVPSGYSFDRHYWREEKNGSYVNSDYIYSNSVGNSRCVTSDNTSNTWDLEMRTRGSNTTTSTTYYDTEDPSVSNDISASSTEHLGDTETSNWYTLSGLAPGSNSINHSMGGSNEGYYKIEFTWDLSVPTSVSTYSVEINGTSYNVALADPNDGALSFNFYRTQVDGDGVLAYDVVDPSDPDALPIYVYHPTHGKLALREKK